MATLCKRLAMVNKVGLALHLFCGKSRGRGSFVVYTIRTNMTNGYRAITNCSTSRTRARPTCTCIGLPQHRECTAALHHVCGPGYRNFINLETSGRKLRIRGLCAFKPCQSILGQKLVSTCRRTMPTGTCIPLPCLPGIRMIRPISTCISLTLDLHDPRRPSVGQPTCFLHTSPRWSWYGHPNVSPEQVNTILHKNETAVELEAHVQHSSVKSFVSNQVASNNPIEDRRAEASCILTKAMLFGVFDGHHGPACAQVISERLFNYIAAEALPYNVLQQAYHMFTKGELFELVDWFPHPNDYVSRDRQLMFRHSLGQYLRDNLTIDYQEDDSVTDVLTTSYDRLDEDLSTEALGSSGGEFNDEGLHTVFSGACACVAYVESDELYVANAGDCRTVLGRQNEDGTWIAVPMSHDHNAQNTEEVKRVRSNHPLEESSTVIKNGRLLSELAPLRAFGDVRFKWSQSVQNQILNPWFGGNVIPRNYHTPPYLIATPEVIHHHLTPADRFLILATDGLWDCLTPEKATHVVGDFLLMSDKVGSFKPEPNEGTLQQIYQTLARRKAALWPRDDNAATHLIRYALGGVQHRFDHHKLANTLSLPDNVVRQYRDDITVTVVFFH